MQPGIEEPKIEDEELASPLDFQFPVLGRSFPVGHFFNLRARYAAKATPTSPSVRNGT